MLPPLYEDDDFSSCMQNHNVFCRVHAKLQPTENGSDLWPIIQAATQYLNKFDRSLLHRGLCIPRQEPYNEETITKYSETVINKRISYSNLTSEIFHMACDDGNISISTYDKIIGISFIFYMCLLVLATMYERRTQGRKISAPGNIITKLSLFYNWKMAINTKGNDDYMRLKAIQGIRFYNMLLILMAHSYLSYIFAFTANPEYLEELTTYYVAKIGQNLSTFVVNTFFLISSWLLSMQLHRIYTEHGELSMKHVAIILINRYFRLAVALAVVTAILPTSWPKYFLPSFNIELIDYTKNACVTNWPSSLFFFNNYFYLADMCNPVTWYLSADFQLYVANALILYVIFKYKLNEKKILGLIFLFSCLIHGMVTYVYEMDTVFRVHLRNYEFHNFLQSLPFTVMYASSHSIWSTSMVGVILGNVYLKNKLTNFEENKILTVIWALLFAGLPSLAIMLSMKERSGISSAILSSLVNPIYVLGIGIGILGMSHGIGGIVKRVCEWKYIVILSNFTYCTYICHYLPCFAKGHPSHPLLHIEAVAMAKSYIWTVFISITAGIILSVTIEQPGITFQKMLLPQVKKYSENKTKKQ